MFQEELQTAEDRARNAQMRYQLATMRAQVQKFGMNPSLDEDVRALERIEERADQAYAESEAITDVAAIGDKAKLNQVRQAARKQRADSALADLKAEMGLTDTERRFQKVDLSASQETQTVTTQPAPQEQQQTVGQKSSDDQGSQS
jgi:phage shock protein A